MKKLPSPFKYCYTHDNETPCTKHKKIEISEVLFLEMIESIKQLQVAYFMANGSDEFYYSIHDLLDNISRAKS